MSDASGSLDRVDRRDVRVVQGRERLRFALKSCEAVGIGGEGIRQHLDRDLAAEARVGGAVDRTHAAFTDLGGDFEDAEARAGSESQTAGMIAVSGTRARLLLQHGPVATDFWASRPALFLMLTNR